MDQGAWWAAVCGVAKSWTPLSDFTFTFHFHALEKEMTTHSGVLAFRIPGTEEPGRLPSMGSHRVGHDWSHLVAAAASYLQIKGEKNSLNISTEAERFYYIQDPLILKDSIKLKIKGNFIDLTKCIYKQTAANNIKWWSIKSFFLELVS